MSETLMEDSRKQLFEKLVAAQDQGMPVTQSRTQLAEEYGVPVEDVRLIEREGIANKWPPFAAE